MHFGVEIDLETDTSSVEKAFYSCTPSFCTSQISEFSYVTMKNLSAHSAWVMGEALPSIFFTTKMFMGAFGNFM